MSDKTALLDDQSNSVSTENVAGQSTTGAIADIDSVPTVNLLQKISAEDIKTSPVRWYILLVFSLLGFTQNAIWNTWGPIAQSSELLFGWSDSTIAMLNNWGPGMYVVTAVFFSWLMDVKGLRTSCIVTSVVVCAGAWVRCLAVNKDIATWVIHLGQLLNGVGGPVVAAAPPLLSVLWFPAHQRITATAVSSSVTIMGSALAFVMGPYLVPDIGDRLACQQPGTKLYNDSNCHHKISDMHSQVMNFLYIEAAAAGFVLLLILCYFPDKPEHCPSVSATIDRTDFRTGIKDLIRNGNFWLLAVPFGLSSGVFQCWLTVLDVNLKPSGISEHTAGWIGFWSIMAGQVAAIVVGIFADLFEKKMKTMFITLYTAAGLVFFVFAVECSNIIPMSTALLYTTSVFGSMCLFATIPLFFELGCECAYPVAEGVTNMAMTLLLNAAGLLFLLLFTIPNIGTSWTSWALVLSVCGCIPVFTLFKETYKRSDQSKTHVC